MPTTSRLLMLVLVSAAAVGIGASESPRADGEEIKADTARPAITADRAAIVAPGGTAGTATGTGLQPTELNRDATMARLRAAPSTEQLRRWHDLFGSEPHVAGTPGDARVIARLHGAFVAMGLEVEVQEIHPLLARPVDALLELVEMGTSSSDASRASDTAITPTGSTAPAASAHRRGVISLALQERNLLEDPSTAHPGLSYGWNAYSGSGDVEAEVVYVNYGTRADFDALAEMDVDPRGRILLARYGGNFRGDKVRFAEAVGAAAMIVYGDPADVVRGEVYPDGGWANDTCIQRGSILRLGQPGDPLTPGVPATLDAPRLAIEEVALPRIPVQPIGYAAAGAILARMTGDEAPEAWRGGLPLTYRVEGGPMLRLRLRVEQVREIMQTANVVATLPGRTDEIVVVGCHHDAWGFGAGDPLAGTIALMEVARAFGDAARDGWRPLRTIKFAAWGAEEFGIIGSTEWCEAHADALSRSALAYVNLDMASMGPNFHASAAPTLAAVIRDAARRVPQAGDPMRTVYDAWSARVDGSIPPVGLIGGGSDHEAFQFRLGIPSLGLGAGGSPGTSYHSNYDTLQWYRQIVGEDYESALMVTRMALEVLLSLADDPVPPIDPAAILPLLRGAIESAVAAAEAKELTLETSALGKALDRLGEASERAPRPEALLALERRFLLEQTPTEGRAALSGETATPWSRHRLYGTNPDAGYSTETLPRLRAAIRLRDRSTAQVELDELARMVEAFSDQCFGGPS